MRLPTSLPGHTHAAAFVHVSHLMGGVHQRGGRRAAHRAAHRGAVGPERSGRSILKLTSLCRCAGPREAAFCILGAVRRRVSRGKPSRSWASTPIAAALPLRPACGAAARHQAATRASARLPLPTGPPSSTPAPADPAARDRSRRVRQQAARPRVRCLVCLRRSASAIWAPFLFRWLRAPKVRHVASSRVITPARLPWLHL